MRAIKTKKVIPVFGIVSVVNLLLFSVKLYIGLSSNSISIYSDGINNLFDSFSCFLALGCAVFASKNISVLSAFLNRKTEQLLSFLLSVVIFAAGFMFLYNSAERLMYPTPVWFTMSYFSVLCVTAAVKLFMFLFLRSRAGKLKSDTVRMISLDSLLDFFVTVISVLTLYASQEGSFSFDAVGGIVISIFIIVSGIKNIKEALSDLLGFPQRKLRESFEQIILQQGIAEDYEIEFSFGKEKRAYVKAGNITSEESEKLKEIIFKETGIRLYLLK